MTYNSPKFLEKNRYKYKTSYVQIPKTIMLIEKKHTHTLQNLNSQFSNLHCKKNCTHKRTTTISQAVKYAPQHSISSFDRTGQLAYLCSVEGKPKIYQILYF